MTHLNDSGHLLREDVKQFDLGWDAWAVLSVSEQSKSASKAERSFNGHRLLFFLPLVMLGANSQS